MRIFSLKLVAYSIKHSVLFYFTYVVCCSVKVRKQSFIMYFLKVFTNCVSMAKIRHLYHFIFYHGFNDFFFAKYCVGGVYLEIWFMMFRMY